MRKAWSICVVSLVLAGCGPVNPPPPGYVEACYGGDFRANIEGTRASQFIIVEAKESDWPRLAQDLSAAGQKLGLEVFNTSAHFDHVRTIEVHLCSKDGIWISADQRIWTGKNAEAANAGKNFGEVPIRVNPYKPDYDWTRVSTELVRMLADSWKVEVRSELRDSSN